MLDADRLGKLVDQCWGDDVVPTLVEYIKIPNKSPSFDPQWDEHGYMDDAVKLFEGWARERITALPGATLEIVRLPGRTPLILIEVPASGAGNNADTVLLYGHLDKQPEMIGWAEGYGPWTPRIDGDRLYGRGGADDGYAMFGALTALLGLRDQQASACALRRPDRGLRGIGQLRPAALHRAPGRPHRQALAGGLPRFGLRQLRPAVDDDVAARHRGRHADGRGADRRRAFGRRLRRRAVELPHPAHAAVAPRGREQRRDPAARALRPDPAGAHRSRRASRRRRWARRSTPSFRSRRGSGRWATTSTELVLNRTWRPQLAVTGIDGLPTPGNAGNVLLPFTTAKLSLRLPPTSDAEAAGTVLKALFEEDPPYGARVRFESEAASPGWNAPALAPWLEASLARASESAFGAPPAYMGEGGRIPFMAMLGEKFPQAQFVITGVLGPHSNAHGPNEFLHIPTGRRITRVIAQVLADHAARGA